MSIAAHNGIPLRSDLGIAGNIFKAFGGVITFDGDYVIHTWNDSRRPNIFMPNPGLDPSLGTFKVFKTIDASVLIAAGGGTGGGSSADLTYGGGGGGAGGLTITNFTFTPNTYNLQIGYGGFDSYSFTQRTGQDSFIGNDISTYLMRAYGGGIPGGNGGSGGGANYGGSPGAAISGSPTSFGHAGGTDSAPYGGSGGGAGGAGNQYGAAGPGVYSSITGESIEYCRGGLRANKTVSSYGIGWGGNGAPTGYSNSISGFNGAIIIRYKYK